MWHQMLAVLRKEKKEAEKKQTENMYADLLNRDHNSFWKSWNKLNKVGNSLVTRIKGETDEKNIANVFASYFESVYGGSDTDEHLKLKMNLRILSQAIFLITLMMISCPHT